MVVSRVVSISSCTTTNFTSSYNPRCGVCQAFAPTWMEAAAKSKIRQYANMAKVDITVHKELSTLYQIAALPTIKL